MTLFTLLIIVWTGATDGGVAMTQVGSFTTKELCEAARLQVPAGTGRVYAVCLPIR